MFDRWRRTRDSDKNRKIDVEVRTASRGRLDCDSSSQDGAMSLAASYSSSCFFLLSICVFFTFYFYFSHLLSNFINPLWNCTVRGHTLVTFSLLFALFFGLFRSALCDPLSHGSTVYSRGQLLALRPSGLIHVERPRIPEELRRKWMGCRAEVQRREKRRRLKHVYQRSPWGTSALSNKMDKLSASTLPNFTRYVSRHTGDN